MDVITDFQITLITWLFAGLEIGLWIALNLVGWNPIGQSFGVALPQNICKLKKKRFCTAFSYIGSWKEKIIIWLN